MIRIERIRSATAVPVSLRGEGRIKLASALIEMAQGDAFAFKSSVWKVAKAQLKKESFGKCAYCEAPTSVVAHGDVEHFRPKSVYWWLAYCYDNYLFSCQLCNQTFKGDGFPVAAARLKPPKFKSAKTASALRKLAERLSPDPLSADATFFKSIRGEKAHLIDPYDSKPESLFAWKADDTLREVRLIPKAGAKGASTATKAAEELYGLNRQEPLVERYRLYEELLLIKAVLENHASPATATKLAKNRVKKLISSESRFAAVARYFLVSQWGVA